MHEVGRVPQQIPVGLRPARLRRDGRGVVDRAGVEHHTTVAARFSSSLNSTQ